MSNHRPQGSRKKSLIERKELQMGLASNLESESLVTHGYLKSFDGIKLFYSLEGKGRPLVFCYGLVCSSLHWTYQIEHFQKDYQAVWFDYRGHNNSETPTDLKSLTVSNMAKDLGVVLDELNLESPILLGHSMGVNVVLEFYRQQPKRVAGMVLANGTAKRPLETLFNMNAFQAAFKLLRKAHKFSPTLVEKIWKLQSKNPLTRTLIALGGFNPHLTPKSDIDLYVKQVGEMNPEILLSLIENYDTFDATPWLHTIQVPTLIIAGEEDKVVPPAQQELLHQLIPDSELVIIRHGSHCPQMDLPELVNHKIENFLSRIGFDSPQSPITPERDQPLT